MQYFSVKTEQHEAIENLPSDENVNETLNDLISFDIADIPMVTNILFPEVDPDVNIDDQRPPFKELQNILASRLNETVNSENASMDFDGYEIEYSNEEY